MSTQYVMVRLDRATKELWVEAAHDERVSLSEWVRRAAEARLGGGVAAPRREGSSGFESPSVAPPPSLDVVSPDAGRDVRVGKSSFRPDPKKKAGLGSGGVARAADSPSPGAAAAPPEPSPRGFSPDFKKGKR